MEIGEKLRKINIACGLNLFVVVSACHGGYAAMATQLMSASPFFALCGPLEEVSAGDLLDDYERFYRELFLSRDCNLALDALNNGSQTTYLGVPARYLFNLGWSHYTEKLCSGKALRERVERVVQQALDGGIPRSKISQLRKHARQFIRDPRHSFEEARDIFFMYDSYPENRNRFPFDYSELESDA